ncbi:hypothetical protein P4O66_015100 [Electrophorus voltai]|uniref:Uncharacterized protein n=1 Tax=Electrophorus voltai TaxID=2609070 RepID=A0AAD8YYK4_9TELE|nr:hypothetical protein P4O66_015100 [Electrophorus voltai]
MQKLQEIVKERLSVRERERKEIEMEEERQKKNKRYSSNLDKSVIEQCGDNLPHSDNSISVSKAAPSAQSPPGFCWKYTGTKRLSPRSCGTSTRSTYVQLVGAAWLSRRREHESSASGKEPFPGFKDPFTDQIPPSVLRSHAGPVQGGMLFIISALKPASEKMKRISGMKLSSGAPRLQLLVIHDKPRSRPDSPRSLNIRRPISMMHPATVLCPVAGAKLTLPWQHPDQDAEWMFVGVAAALPTWLRGGADEGCMLVHSVPASSLVHSAAVPARQAGAHLTHRSCLADATPRPQIKQSLGTCPASRGENRRPRCGSDPSTLQRDSCWNTWTTGAAGHRIWPSGESDITVQDGVCSHEIRPWKLTELRPCAHDPTKPFSR